MTKSPESMHLLFLEYFCPGMTYLHGKINKHIISQKIFLKTAWHFQNYDTLCNIIYRIQGLFRKHYWGVEAFRFSPAKSEHPSLMIGRNWIPPPPRIFSEQSLKCLKFNISGLAGFPH